MHLVPGGTRWLEKTVSHFISLGVGGKGRLHGKCCCGRGCTQYRCPNLPQGADGHWQNWLWPRERPPTSVLKAIRSHQYSVMDPTYPCRPGGQFPSIYPDWSRKETVWWSPIISPAFPPFQLTGAFGGKRVGRRHWTGSKHEAWSPDLPLSLCFGTKYLKSLSLKFFTFTIKVWVVLKDQKR